MAVVSNFQARHAKRSRAFGREAATERGGKVMDAAVAAAREQLMDCWLHELTLVKIAAQADLVRASVLLQFPGGLPDIVSTVAMREMGLFDKGYQDAQCVPGLGRVERVMRAFEPLFAAAERSGRLYANLRGAMFTWGEENRGIFRLGLTDYLDMTAELLTGASPQGDPTAVRRLGYLSEAVFNAALNVAAAQDKWPSNWLERRQAFRTLVATVVAVVSGVARTRVRKSKLTPQRLRRPS